MRNKWYARFYTRYAGRAEPVEGLGSHSVVLLDGRLNSRNMHAVSADTAKRRGFVGYKIYFGTFTHPLRSSNYVSVETRTDLGTISEKLNART